MNFHSSGYITSNDWSITYPNSSSATNYSNGICWVGDNTGRVTPMENRAMIYERMMEDRMRYIGKVLAEWDESVQPQVKPKKAPPKDHRKMTKGTEEFFKKLREKREGTQ